MYLVKFTALIQLYL